MLIFFSFIATCNPTVNLQQLADSTGSERKEMPLLRFELTSLCLREDCISDLLNIINIINSPAGLLIPPPFRETGNYGSPQLSSLSYLNCNYFLRNIQSQIQEMDFVRLSCFRNTYSSHSYSTCGAPMTQNGL